MILVGSLLLSKKCRQQLLHLRASVHGMFLMSVELARRRPPVLLNIHGSRDLSSMLYSAAADCAGIRLSFQLT